ncbi:hypothetical protein ZIOFF_060141 [Zingiber officinale]|uniref:Malectin-like domain-containing protein n=1 Tax=Zingiber officinale TaxID=94328 RepID=A0A8J5FBA9_ZINOF|nr:hypothetical protein ZIOFF_060141 [Zingiber officinale]
MASRRRQRSNGDDPATRQRDLHDIELVDLRRQVQQFDHGNDYSSDDGHVAAYCPNHSIITFVDKEDDEEPYEMDTGIAFVIFSSKVIFRGCLTCELHFLGESLDFFKSDDEVLPLLGILAAAVLVDGQPGTCLLQKLFIPDAEFIDTGSNHELGETDITVKPTQARNLQNCRNGIRNCYTIKNVSQGYKYLIRASFLHGNYDKDSSHTDNGSLTFDLYLGVSLWKTMRIIDADQLYIAEIITFASSDSFLICLLRTGNGTQFRSALELSPIDNGIYHDVNQTVSLLLWERWDMGSHQTFRIKGVNESSCSRAARSKGLPIPPPSDEASEDRGVETSTTRVSEELPSKSSPTPVSSSPKKVASPKKQRKKQKLTLAPSPMRQVIAAQSTPAQEDIQGQSPEQTLVVFYPTLLTFALDQPREDTSLLGCSPNTILFISPGLSTIFVAPDDPPQSSIIFSLPTA